MGFEPTTSTLARLRSTPELHPLWMTGALRRPCGKEYIEVSGFGKIFLEKNSCFMKQKPAALRVEESPCFYEGFSSL